MTTGTPNNDVAVVTNLSDNKPTPASTDKFGYLDVVALKWVYLTWANVKASLKNYFDGVYLSSVATDTTLTGDGSLTSPLSVSSAGGGGNGFQVDSSGGTADTYGVLSGAINGSNTVFSVSYGSYVSGALQVYLSGQLLTQGTSEDWVETTPASGTFTFATAPVAGDVIIAFYKYASVATSNADTLDGYEASAFATTALPMVGRGTVEVDFGTGALSQVVTVTDALATSGSFITASTLCKATASNTADEIMAQPFDVKIKSQTTGSFDIVVTSLIGKALQEVPVSYILMN